MAAGFVEADVCIHGATASGIAAAIGAADAGAKVIVVEPSRWLGGMSGGGLNAIDWGYRQSVGRMARRLLIDKDDVAMRKLYQSELARRGIPVIREHRLASVVKEGVRIRRIILDHAPPDQLGCPIEQPLTREARTVAARVFIDCSYEGDLMAKSGVSYTWGRESREEYSESLGGVRPILMRYDIDPYVKPGEPKSGLLPLLQDICIGPPGSADKLTMMYAFRWVLTRKDPIRIEKPDEYDPRHYEIFRRGFQKGVDMRAGRKMHVLGEYSENNGWGIFSGNSSRALWAQSVAGGNAAYPDGDWATRSRIWRDQMNFVRGMYHFLRTDPSAPPEFRERAEAIGFQRGIFDETNGWPHQLYVREARRMKSDYTVTQKDLEGATTPEDSVGLGSYGVDDWPYATIAHEGRIALSGGEFSIMKANTAHSGIHRLPYRAIRPRQNECENLLVPVCCSASHIAMTCIRMEPVWITLGLSAGLAAAQAIKENVAVQAIDFPRYRRALLDAGQILELNETEAVGWNSRDEWNEAKRGYEWAFDGIDKDKDGRISPEEYRGFQAFKQKHKDWQERLKAKAVPPASP
ncbi:MAG: FAD-dependent oxidoreductase [Verrucomicrobia bacterium]|nr:FAD-dependent oxidoreductase [Verrucomicrobiota bacterium]